MTLVQPELIENAEVTVPKGLSLHNVKALLPGLAVTAAVATAGFTLNRLPYVGIFSPLILSILLGIVVRNTIGLPVAAKPGITFSLRRVLRFAIILLGLQLTVAQVGEVGAIGVGAIALTLVATFLFTTLLGRVLGVEPKLAQLIAAGTSICGASAVIAVDTVTHAADEDVAYAVACVTIFGSIAMFAYPALPALLHLAPAAYGLWAGSSIHEIAQVVAAAFQHGQHAGEIATIAKLTRVGLLAPVVLTLGFLAARRSRNASSADDAAAATRTPVPWFVFGFLALMAFNSVLPLHGEFKQTIVIVTTFLLSVALAAMGLETDLRKLRAKGLRPLLLGFASFLFIATFSLGLVKIIT
jgi:uncharacterized integral membrane protein (TIGR00698 family)